MAQSRVGKIGRQFICLAFGVLIQQSAAFGQSGCQNYFINPHTTYSHYTAHASASPLPLEPGPPLGAVTYKIAGDARTYTLDDFLTKFCTTGFLVLKDGQVVYERYLHGYSAKDRFLSASMSKSLLSLLLGVANGEGKLALDERVGSVLPDFQGSAFAESTVEDLLRMASGVALVNSFDNGADSDNRATNPIVSPGENVREYLRRKTDRSAATGTQFQYNGAQTALLGTILRERVGITLTSYLEEKIWKPMGAENDAYWIKNNRGEEGVQGQFVASLRDYARLGYLVMNHGQRGDQHIVPADWINTMTELRRDKPQPGKPPFYGLHVWIPQAAGGRSMFWGVNGQNIFIDPVAHVVIVHTGNSPNAGFDGNAHLFALRDAIARKLTAVEK
jgi:CubicO group peptidase (beta-lactamase class C family)